jgi:outer membrane receptor protein involved in Fe transport
LNSPAHFQGCTPNREPRRPEALAALLAMLMLLPAINALAGELETATQAPFEATTALTEDGGSAGGTDVALPTKHGGASLAAASVSILAVPRSLTQISPELIEDFNLTNVGDLVKLGAGTQTYNYYGLPGTPIIRGAKGGTFLDGMLRAYQRSEMPVSFAAVGSIEVVKGPAPVHLSPTLVGGFVNLIPKKPDFEKAAGSLEFSADNWAAVPAQSTTVRRSPCPAAIPRPFVLR